MQKISYVNASDGLANASLMTVTTIRSAAATEILVNTTADAPAAGFFATMGTPHTFTDPVTGETIQIISEATAVDFYGHISSGKVEIDGISPGYVDGGSKVGDIVVIKPTTDWANNLRNILNQSLADNGAIKAGAISDPLMFSTAVSPAQRIIDTGFNYIVSGCVWTADAAGSTRAASMTAGVVYVNGKRLTVAAVTAHLFTASKDTYVDFQDNLDGTAKLVYTEATNNAASPAIPNSLVDATNIRNAILITGASNIANAAAINQGQYNALLPIVSSTPYAFTDSLGNLINPRDPNRKVIGYRQSTINFVTSSSSYVDITGMADCPVIIPPGRNVKISGHSGDAFNVSSGDTVSLNVYDATAAVQLNEDNITTTSGVINAGILSPTAPVYTPPASGARDFKVRCKVNASSGQLNNSGQSPTTIIVELI